MLRDVLGLFPQGRHHPTALFVLRSLVPLLGEESVSGMFRGTGVKLTQLVPGGCVRRGCVSGCVGGHIGWVCQWVCQMGVSVGVQNLHMYVQYVVSVNGKSA